MTMPIVVSRRKNPEAASGSERALMRLQEYRKSDTQEELVGQQKRRTRGQANGRAGLVFFLCVVSFS